MYKEYMPNRYENQDAQARLADTFIRYNNKAVYVAESDARSKTLRLYELPLAEDGRSEPKNIRWDDPGLDISSIELGYGNYTRTEANGTKVNRVFYISRLPQKRTYRQGVHAHSLSVEDIAGRSSVGNITQFTNYTDQGWTDLLNGVYPKGDERIFMMAMCSELALSKDVAISKDRFGLMYIYIRGEQVAFKSPDSDAICLRDFRNVWTVEKIIRREFPEFSIKTVKTAA